MFVFKFCLSIVRGVEITEETRIADSIKLHKVALDMGTDGV